MFWLRLASSLATKETSVPKENNSINHNQASCCDCDSDELVFVTVTDALMGQDINKNDCVTCGVLIQVQRITW